MYPRTSTTFADLSGVGMICETMSDGINLRAEGTRMNLLRNVERSTTEVVCDARQNAVGCRKSGGKQVETRRLVFAWMRFITPRSSGTEAAPPDSPSAISLS